MNENQVPGASYSSAPEGSPYPNPQQQFRKMLRGNSNTVGFGLLLNIVISLFLPVLLGFGAGFISLDIDTLSISVDDQSIAYHLGNLITYIVAFLGPGLLMAAVVGIPAKAAIPRKPVPAGLIAAAACVNLAVVVGGVSLASMLSVFLESVFGLVPTMADISLPEDPVGILLNFALIGIVAPICEELVFRGVVMQSLRRFGDGFALIGSSILFSFAHGNLVQGPNAFISGLVMGYFVLRTGSVATGIWMHLVNNSLAMIFELLLRSIPGGDSLYGLMLLFYLALGAAGFLWMRLRYPNFYVSLPRRLPVSEGWKYKHFFTTPGFILYFLAVLGITMVNFQ
ncbi:CPBP family intramembrane glutamic endopeptidase [Oscillospiraceae bacterium MB08-C2-2]|nr:CPBP family intramembrane glutamic endopeptidase [Oscillospiraceae bacterium MB08-C2-2]